MKLYLDDERTTPEGWCRAFTAKECINILNTGEVTVVSLDHDLGTKQTGMTVLDWIAEQVHCHDFDPPEILIHTANVAAKGPMIMTVKGIQKFIKEKQE